MVWFKGGFDKEEGDISQEAFDKDQAKYQLRVSERLLREEAERSRKKQEDLKLEKIIQEGIEGRLE